METDCRPSFAALSPEEYEIYGVEEEEQKESWKVTNASWAADVASESEIRAAIGASSQPVTKVAQFYSVTGLLTFKEMVEQHAGKLHLTCVMEGTTTELPVPGGNPIIAP